MAKFCTECGSLLPEKGKFCPECGAPVKPAPVVIDAPAGSCVTVSDVPPAPAIRRNTRKDSFASARTKASEPEKKVEPKKQKKGGRRGLSLFLAVVMVAELAVAGFRYPGWFRKEKKPVESVGTSQSLSGFGSQSSGAGNDYYVDTAYQTETVAAGTLTQENRTLQSGGVSLTVHEGFLGADRNAEIRRAVKTVDYTADGVSVPLSIYEFDVDGIHDGSMITIEIPMEKPAGGEIGAGYLDEANQTLVPIPHEYDEARGVLIIHTTHLSAFCGFPVKDEATRSAMLPYLNIYDFMDREDDGSIENYLDLLEASMKAGSSFAAGMELAGQLGEANTILGTVNSIAELGNLVSTTADGAGNSVIIKGTLGTVGEIMNSNWGKAGTWLPGEMKYGPSETIVKYEDKLKSVYPADTIEKLGTGLSIMNIVLSTYKIAVHAMNGDSQKAAWEAAQLGFDRVMSYAGGCMNVPALSVYLVGVSLFAYTLDKIYSTALEGRAEVYMHAYNKYYSNAGTDGGHRTDDDWIAAFKQILKDGGGEAAIEAEIDRYVNEFWVKADSFGPEYLVSVMTEDEKIAWGAAGQGGLTPEMKQKISSSYKVRLLPRMKDVIAKLNEQNRWEMMEQYQKEYDLLRKNMNQKITLEISAADIGEGQTSYYSGCTVRFKDLAGKVKDPTQWETVLNKEGKGAISFTLLAHMTANAGNTIEIVRPGKNGEEEILLTDTFAFKKGSLSGITWLSGSYTLYEPEREPEPEETENVGYSGRLTFDSVTDSSGGLAGEAVIEALKKATLQIEQNGSFTLAAGPAESAVFWDPNDDETKDSGECTMRYTLSYLTVDGEMDYAHPDYSSNSANVSAEMTGYRYGVDRWDPNDGLAYVGDVPPESSSERFETWHSRKDSDCGVSISYESAPDTGEVYQLVTLSLYVRFDVTGHEIRQGNTIETTDEPIEKEDSVWVYVTYRSTEPVGQGGAK